MALSDAKLRNLRLPDGVKRLKVADGQVPGMYLMATAGPRGLSRLFRLDYRIDKARRTMALGSWPDLPLAEARAAARNARSLIAKRIDPIEHARKEDAAAKAEGTETFEAAADAWFKSEAADWAPSYARKIEGILRNYLLPSLGHRPLASLTPPEILTVARKAESDAPEAAVRGLRIVSNVYRHAIREGRATTDPARDLIGAISLPANKPRPALLLPDLVGEYLRRVHGEMGDTTDAVAVQLRLLPHLFVRPGELRLAKVGEFDLQAKVWTVPGARTKQRRDLKVPLSDAVMAMLVPRLQGRMLDEYAFPNERMPLSDAALGNALRRMGYSTSETVTPHGWRATARSLLHERLGYEPAIIEVQLGHAQPGTSNLPGVYARASFWDQRVEMMTRWSAYLEQLRTADPEPMPARKAGRAKK